MAELAVSVFESQVHIAEKLAGFVRRMLSSPRDLAKVNAAFGKLLLACKQVFRAALQARRDASGVFAKQDAFQTKSPAFLCVSGQVLSSCLPESFALYCI